MAKHGARHVRKTSVVGSMAVLVVVALVGYLVVTNLRVNKSATVSNDAAELIEHRVQRVDELQSEVNKLGSQIDDYNTLLRNNEMQSGNSEEAGQSTMLPAVTGPGVTVTLNDSSMWRISRTSRRWWTRCGQEAPNPCRSWTSACCRRPR